MSCITPQTILALLEEIESEDPVDFGALPVDERAARSVVATHLAELRENLMCDAISSEEREALLLAAASRVMLENLLLHVRALTDPTHTDAGAHAAALFARLGLGGAAAP